MGFFSYNCKRCGHPALNDHATNPINKWMSQVVALFPNGDRISGTYDGYGRINNHEYGELYGSRVALYHHACWTVLGKPEYTSASANAEDQGFFFEDPMHDLPEPKSADDPITTPKIEAANATLLAEKERQRQEFIAELTAKGEPIPNWAAQPSTRLHTII